LAFRRLILLLLVFNTWKVPPPVRASSGRSASLLPAYLSLFESRLLVWYFLRSPTPPMLNCFFFCHAAASYIEIDPCESGKSFTLPLQSSVLRKSSRNCYALTRQWKPSKLSHERNAQLPRSSFLSHQAHGPFHGTRHEVHENHNTCRAQSSSRSSVWSNSNARDLLVPRIFTSAAWYFVISHYSPCAYDYLLKVSSHTVASPRKYKQIGGLMGI